MTRFTLALFISSVLGVGALPPQEESETKVTWQQPPVAVQQAVKAHTKGATLRGFSKEIKDRQTLYEAEMRIGGRTRDVTFDERGRKVDANGKRVES